MYGSLQGVLSIGVLEEMVDIILLFLLNCIGCFYFRMMLEIKVYFYVVIMEMLVEGLVDLVLIIYQFFGFIFFILRILFIFWYCVVEYVLVKGEFIFLILFEELSLFCQDIIVVLEIVCVSWYLVYGVFLLLGVKVVVKVGLGVMVCLVEMMSLDLCVVGISEGLLVLLDIWYVVSCNLWMVSELLQVIFQFLSQEIYFWEMGIVFILEEGGNILVL